MKKILFITDNPWIYSRIRSYLKITGFLLKVDFRCSPGDSPLANILQPLSVDNCCEEIIQDYNLVFSAHCLQFFPEKLVNSVRCINIHPGYNPINRGWYPQVFSILNNLKIGATIHEMDVKLDNGPIIAREFVDSFIYDTSEDVYKRVLKAEIKLFKKWFKRIIANDYVCSKPESAGNFYSKADFISLCKLNLDDQIKMRDSINLLRALTHGKYNNAYFIDEVTNKKIYVSVRFKVEE
jgi:methionyl-tRNA formyltransferase